MNFSIRHFFFSRIGWGIVTILTFTSNSFSQNTVDTAKQYIEEGRKYYLKDDFQKSIDNYNKAEAILKKLEDEQLMCVVHYMKGHVFLRDGKNQQALNAYDKALLIADNLGDLDKRVITNSGRIVVLKRLNQLDRALAIARDMIQSIGQTSFENTKNHVNVLTTSSEIYLEKEQYDSVLYYADVGIKLSKSLDYKEGLADLYIKKGIVHYYQENYEESLQYLFKVKEILEQYDTYNEFYPTVNSNYFLAANYYQQKSYNKAIDYLLNTVKLVKENDEGIKPPVIQSYLLLANCYASKNDFESSLHWHNEYLRLKVSV